MIKHLDVVGDDVRLIMLPKYTPKTVAAFTRFVESDKIFGLDVESTAIEGLGTYDPSIKMRMIQFGNRTEAWALDVRHRGWRKLITSLLRDEAKRFVSHNASFDTVRVWFEYKIWLGDRSIDTLPMASLLWPGITKPKGLKDLSDEHIDTQLSEAEVWLHARFVDLYTAQKPRKTRLLPVNFEPGVSVCRQTKKKGEEKCQQPSFAGSLCGWCIDHYLERGRKKHKDAEQWGWRNIALDDPFFTEYAGLDAVYVRRLLDILNDLIKKARMAELGRTEQRVKRYMTRESVRGMLVDQEWTKPILEETEREFDAACDRIEAATGVKARSNYMADWFRGQGVKVKSLDKNHLPDLLERHGDHEIVGPVLRDLEIVSTNSNLLTNLRTTWKHATEGDGFVHPNINTLQAHTGRMSATQPAVQTLAKKGEKGTKLRGCYIARPGFILAGADYDSQEIRIGAALSGDKALLRIVHEGLNQHVLTAESLFPEWVDKATNPDLYAKAKVLDFAQQYGAGPAKIARQLGITPSEAFVLWQKWRHTYRGLVEWNDRMAKLRKVRNPFGRVIPRDPYRDYANGNYMIQSTGRDVLGAALCRLADAGWADYFWLPIHDELVMEVPEDRAEEACAALTECMSTEVLGVPVPAEGEIIGRRWKGLG